METKPRIRSFLAIFAWFALVLALPAAFPKAAPAQVSGEEEASDEVVAAEKSDLPPIPEWTPADPLVAAQFEKARQDLDEKRFDDAERGFKKLKSKARGTPGEAAIERCLKEADGGQLCEKAGKYQEKGQPRKILALWEKEAKKVEGTFTGEELRKFFDEAFAEVFQNLADFDKKSDDEKKEEADDEGDEPERGGDARGRTEYGQNTRLVSGKPEEGEVRQGNGSLYWMLTKDIGYVTVKIPDEVDAEDYRYLRISMRTEESRAKPQLAVIFDCEAGNLAGGGQGGGGQGGRRGGRRGNWQANQVRNRVGFHGEATPGYRWQDMRLDLRKFEERGNARWANVLNLRIVHLGAGAETGIFIDNVILEKE